MNEELDSQLSAMFDDELPQSECELLARRLARDAALLGGSVLDLLAREEGEAAAVQLCLSLPRGDAREALLKAFRGRPLVDTEGLWRAHLARLAEP